MLHVAQVKQMLAQAESQTPLPNGQTYVNTATGQSSTFLKRVPQLSVVFMQGGGSVVDYEMIKRHVPQANGSQKTQQVIFGTDLLQNPL